MAHDGAAGQSPGLPVEQVWTRADGFGSGDMPSPMDGLPDDLGTVAYAGSVLRPGLDLFVYRARLEAPVTFSFRVLTGEPYFWLPVVLSGRGAFRHHRLSGEGVAGMTWMALLREPDTDLFHRPREEMESVEMIVTPRRLRDMTRGQRLPAAVERFADGRCEPMAAGMRTTATMGRIAEQVRCNPYQGAMASLYAEAKACEILAEALSILADRDEPADRVSSARRRAMAARDIMVADLSNPPRIADVARQVGLSQRQLDDVFKDVFDATPLQCLTMWRLDAARTVLARGDLSVKQVAYLMGYAHVSSFSYAYTRRFGEPPSCR